MISVQQVVTQIIHRQPYLEDMLANNLINLSSLARQIKNQVAQETKKQVTVGSIVMALKRLSISLKPQLYGRLLIDTVNNLNEITIRSHLTELVFTNSPSLNQKQKLILAGQKDSHHFMALTKGRKETNIIISHQLTNKVKNILKQEKLVYQRDNLTAVSIQLPDNSINIPGIYYYILKLLALNNISIVEVVSTYSEFILILETSNLQPVLSLLQPH